MLVNVRGQVFVGQRNDRNKAAWQMPQGGIDKGEAAQDAMLRELWEETGVRAALIEVLAETANWVTYDLPVDLVPNIWKGQYRGQKQKWFLLRFLGADSDINIDTDHPELTAWRWAPVDGLVGEIVDFKRAVYAQVVDEFAPVIAKHF